MTIILIEVLGCLLYNIIPVVRELPSLLGTECGERSLWYSVEMKTNPREGWGPLQKEYTREKWEPFPWRTIQPKQLYSTMAFPKGKWVVWISTGIHGSHEALIIIGQPLKQCCFTSLQCPSPPGQGESCAASYLYLGLATCANKECIKSTTEMPHDSNTSGETHPWNKVQVTKQEAERCSRTCKHKLLWLSGEISCFAASSFSSSSSFFF